MSSPTLFVDMKDMESLTLTRSWKGQPIGEAAESAVSKIAPGRTDQHLEDILRMYNSKWDVQTAVAAAVEAELERRRTALIGHGR